MYFYLILLATTVKLASTLAENVTKLEPEDPCKAFTDGLTDYEFTSPNYPHEYPKLTNCIKLISAPPGQLIQVQFVDTFQLEEIEEGICKYDFVEVRDGQFAYSPTKGKFCGSIPPFPYLQSSGQFLWMRFYSDETIGFPGFRATISFVDARVAQEEVGHCSFTYTDIQGLINTETQISQTIWQRANQSKLPVDCTWIVRADPGKNISLQFATLELELERPNRCDYNFVQIYRSSIEFRGKVKEPDRNCGSVIHNVKSGDNLLAVRFFSMVGPFDKRSKLRANYTIIRETTTKNGTKLEPCGDEEFDCKDGFCVAKSLQCNGVINCERPIDEEKCDDATKQLTADILVIAFIGCLLIAGMCGGLIMNIYRKLKQDREDLKELRESIRSRDSCHASTHESVILKIDHQTPSVSETGVSVATVMERQPDRLSFEKVNEAPAQFEKPAKPEKVAAIEKPAKLTMEKFPQLDKSIIPYSPPPMYPHSSPPLKPRDQAQAPPTTATQEICIEVRDCACQTRESLLASRRRRSSPSAAGAPLALAEYYDYSATPIRRIRLPRADIVAVYPFFRPTASSASSETGRSLERLDEYQE